jgi:hypothetical protein
MVSDYKSFLEKLILAGFSMGGGNSEGIYSVISWNWNQEAPYDTKVRWHTGDPDTDPWEWRMRVLDERRDIAYAKVFFRKSGYITKEWYPYFLAVRRGGELFGWEASLRDLSPTARVIYELIKDNNVLPLHTIKALGGFSSVDKTAFDRALTELQMKMYVTMCGRQQKLSMKGEEYGWSSTVFCPVEVFFGEETLELARSISIEEAYSKIVEQVYQLNPDADPKKVDRFIKG